MTGSPAAPVLEVVAIGDELLFGRTVDTNSAWLAERLASAGIRVARGTIVGDVVDHIAAAVADGLQRTGTVLCTGGLGPTSDDVTKPAVAGLFRRRLVMDDALLASIRSRFEARGLDMPESNRTQAEVPERARVLPNSRGTAPGLAIEDDTRLVVMMPGVPFEMHAVFEDGVVPLLARRWPHAAKRSVRHHVLRTTGIPESALAERLAGVAERIAPLRLAFLPDPTGVDLRITTGTLDATEAEGALAAADRLIAERVAPWLYARGDARLVDVVAADLRRRRRSLAVAESCTGGMIGEWITSVPGASDFFQGGVIAYADAVKTSLLDVDSAIIQGYGAVSEASARAMAAGVRRRFGVDAGLAVTGIAGPGGGTESKPVGTVWIAVDVNGRAEARHFLFPGDRDEVRRRAAQAALAVLRESIRDAADPASDRR